MLHELPTQPDRWDKIRRPFPWPEVIDYPECLFQRRSSRNFVQKPITEETLSALLESLCAPGFGNANEIYNKAQSICIGFLIGNAEALGPGFYLLDMKSQSIGLVTTGDFIEQMAHICLDQGWLANAALHFLFMANLKVLGDRWGPRGYRYAMMTAGRLGERLYLTAAAMGLGCCGIGAFYDMEAAELLDLGDQSRLLYLVAVGSAKSGLKS